MFSAVEHFQYCEGCDHYIGGCQYFVRIPTVNLPMFSIQGNTISTLEGAHFSRGYYQYCGG